MKNRRESQAALDDGGAHESSSGSRPRTIAIVILAVTALVGVAVYLLRPPDSNKPPATTETPLPQVKSDTAPLAVLPAPPSRSEPAAAVGPPFPDLPAELPPTSDLLFEELKQVTDYLQQRFPNEPDPIEIAARVQLWRGNVDEAVRLWEKCVQLVPNYGHAYHGMGSAAAKRGEYEAAAEFFRESLQLNPTSTESQIALGDALINAGEIEEAIAVLKLSPGPVAPSAEREALLGQACLQTQDYEAAKAHYELAVRLDPYLSDAHYGLTLACSRLGKTDEAAEHTAKFRELRARERKIRSDNKKDYDDLEATRSEVAIKYTDVGTVLLTRGHESQAETLWQRAADLAPEDANCRQALAWIYRQANRREDAIRMLKQLAELDPEGVEYVVEVGRIQAELGNFDAAEQSFRQAREKAPRHPDGYLAAARLYVDRKTNLPEAVVLATEAVALEPTASNYELLSAAYGMNGNRAEALAAIVLAMTLDPDEPRFRERHQRLKAEE